MLNALTSKQQSVAAGAKANAKLTFEIDHTAGADHTLGASRLASSKDYVHPMDVAIIYEGNSSFGFRQHFAI